MFRFFVQFLKNPRSIGAIAPSSKYLARKMMKPIHFSTAKCIVEYGPGSGAFTKELVKRKNADTVLILIEQNVQFYKQLQRKYGEQENVHVIFGSAERVGSYLAEYGFFHTDYIVSGLPFTSLPENISDKIFVNTQTVLGRKGVFITFQYSMVKQKLFERYFKLVGGLLEFWNIPPAYVLVMKAG